MTCAFAILLAVALSVFSTFGGITPNDAFNDGIDRTDPNFVTASLLVMSPGNELYSCAGHSCFRLECPTFKLDYCFSYESESAKGRMFSLLSGNLKMGMFSVPTQEYLKGFAEAGRRVVQYKLNLPPDVKQRLWKALDESVSEGIELPYDVLRRGCAQSMVNALLKVLPPYQLTVPEWPEKYVNTRRELVESAVNDRLWTRLFLHTLSGTELDRSVSKLEKVVVPDDLVEFLRMARIGKQVVITENAVELLPLKFQPKSSVFTPMMAATLVAVSVALNLLVKVSWLEMFFAGFQALFGVGLAYLVFISDLFGTNWNWLIVPFNLLPLLFWKWRKKWAPWFAGVLLLWEAGMIFWPHRLTDPAYLVLVGAYVLMYARIGWKWNCAAMARRTAEPASAGLRPVAAAMKGDML